MEHVIKLLIVDDETRFLKAIAQRSLQAGLRRPHRLQRTGSHRSGPEGEVRHRPPRPEDARDGRRRGAEDPEGGAPLPGSHHAHRPRLSGERRGADEGGSLQLSAQALRAGQARPGVEGRLRGPAARRSSPPTRPSWTPSSGWPPGRAHWGSSGSSGSWTTSGGEGLLRPAASPPAPGAVPARRAWTDTRPGEGPGVARR